MAFSRAVARPDGRLDRRRVFGVDHQRRLREQRLPVVPHPAAADAGAGTGIVMAVQADEHERPAALSLRQLRVELGQADDRRHPAGVVTGGVEPSVTVGDEVDRLVGGAFERAPNQRALEVRHPLHLERGLDASRLSLQEARQSGPARRSPRRFRPRRRAPWCLTDRPDSACCQAACPPRRSPTRPCHRPGAPRLRSRSPVWLNTNTALPRTSLPAKSASLPSPAYTASTSMPPAGRPAAP